MLFSVCTLGLSDELVCLGVLLFSVCTLGLSDELVCLASYNMYPDGGGGGQMTNGPPVPSINNSGSLPDLSSLNFPSPMPQAIDTDDMGTPPYSCVSPAERQ